MISIHKIVIACFYWPPGPQPRCLSSTASVRPRSESKITEQPVRLINYYLFRTLIAAQRLVGSSLPSRTEFTTLYDCSGPLIDVDAIAECQGDGG